MKQFLERHAALVVATLAALVVLSLAFNGYLLWRSLRTDDRVEEVAGGAALVVSQAAGLFEALDEIGPLADQALGDVTSELEAFRTSTLEFEVAVDQEIPVRTSFPFSRTIDLPIRTTLPVSEEFETRIEVAGPFGVDIPLTVTVPIDIEVPVNIDLEIPIDETIEIDTTFPLRLDVPVSVAIEGSGLDRLAEQLQQGLEQVSGVLAGLGGS